MSASFCSPSVSAHVAAPTPISAPIAEQSASRSADSDSTIAETEALEHVEVDDCPSIPLPDDSAPSTPLFPRVARRVVALGCLSQEDCDRLSELSERDATVAFDQLLDIWQSNDEHLDGARRARTMHLDPSRYGQSLQPSTLRADILSALSDGGMEQQRAIEFLLAGLRDGFDIGHRSSDELRNKEWSSPPPKTLEMANKLEENVKSEIAKGRVAEITSLSDEGRQLVSIHNASLTFGVEKMELSMPTGDVRMCTHLSKGNDEFPSVNSKIPRASSRISYAAAEEFQRALIAADAANRAEARQKGAVVTPPCMGKVDVEQAYRCIPIKPSCWPLLCFTDSHGRVFVDTRLPFGLASACRIWSVLSLTVAWVLKHVGAVLAATYLDDLSNVERDASRSRLSVSVMVKLFKLLGAPCKARKTESACLLMVNLGFQYDSVHLTMSVPPNKVRLVLDILASWLGREHARRIDVQRLVGCLCWCAQVVPPGRLFLNRVFALLRAFHKVSEHAHLRLSEVVRSDFRFWRAFFSHFNGRSLRVAEGAEEHVWTDASDTAGAGVWRDLMFCVPWRDFFSYLAPPQSDIATREMWAIAAAVSLWAPKWTGKRVRFYCDNQSDVAALENWRCRNDKTLALMRYIVLMASIYQFEFAVEWLRSADNAGADLATRVPIAEFDRQTQNRYHQEIVSQPPPRPSEEEWEDQLCHRLSGLLSGKLL